MNVARSLVVLAGMVGALGTGCVARVHTHAYVAHGDIVWVEPPPLVYVDGVYVVQDSDVGVYYVDGYYWYESDGFWYRRTYYNDPWVSVHVSFVPVHVAHLDHHHYAHYHGSGAVYREPARPNKTAHHESANPSSGHASADAHGSVKVDTDERRSVSESAQKAESRKKADDGGSIDRAPSKAANSRVEASRADSTDDAPSASRGGGKNAPPVSRERAPDSVDSERGVKPDVEREARPAPDSGSATNAPKKVKKKPKSKSRRQPSR
jgi:hypothetical protein